MERATERLASDAGAPYISLFGFPISPEALILIDEDEARSQKVICFLYDGQHIRIGMPDPNRPVMGDLLTRLCQENHTDGNIYLISDHSLEYALKLYSAIPKARRFAPVTWRSGRASLTVFPKILELQGPAGVYR